MAANLTPYYHLQSSFAGGEISPEVANRVDLDKYSSAVLKAANCLIRPYGPIYKRPGLKYIAQAKYSDKKSILVPFNGSGNEDYLLEIGHEYIRVHKNGQYLGVELVTPFIENTLSNLRFTQSADTMFIVSGDYPAKTLVRYSDASWDFGNFDISDMYFDMNIIDSAEETTITPSATTGSNITLQASSDLFTADMSGMLIKLKQEVETQEIHFSKTSSNTVEEQKVYVGEQWKIITHGTWTGTVKVLKSYDGVDWTSYRTYTGKNDYNPLESGSVTEPCFMKAEATITSGTCEVSLSAMSYYKEGIAQITSYESASVVRADVIKDFGNTKATKLYYWGAWCDKFGYPKTIAFFQDRLCFGGSKAQPYMLWMSRTGDYGNFSVEKVSGTVTDDSAVAAPLLSRKQFKIKHLLASTDLVILTAGNEWIISGSEVVTPSNINAKMQTTRGCSDVEPVTVGGRIVFVQGRGSTVRDMGYSYETDSYGGNDLTLLAKHIIHGVKIIDSAYKQEPDSILYMVRSDGTMACLTYIYDQKVYAWSTIETEGEIEAVTVIQEGDEDSVYVVIKRNIGGTVVRNIECFNNNNNTCKDPDCYIMLDCATKITLDESEATSVFNVPSLAGATINVLADDRFFENINVESNGDFELPADAANVVAGLPYKMVIELPNVEIKTGDGTMQGRKKQISGCTLRLSNSLGGMIGNDENLLDMIQYDENSDTYKLSLYSGDKEITMPVGGFNLDGRVTIVSDEPFPFNLLMAVREVSFGG